MSKLKTTKKGMAKKTLSISLVTAMLATSNVPVWAAEFTDGTDAALTVIGETADAFSAEEAPVVEAQEEVASAKAVSSNDDYTATVKFTGVTSNAVTWGSAINVNMDEFSVSKKEEDDYYDCTYDVEYAWKVDGVAVTDTKSVASYNETEEKWVYSVDSYTPENTDAGKKVTLFLMIRRYNQVLWTYTSDEITVNAQPVGNLLTLQGGLATEVIYDGEEQCMDMTGKITVSPSAKDDPADSDKKYYKVTYKGEDYVNVTGKDITVTVTAAIPGYEGELTHKYQIKPMTLGSEEAIAAVMEAALKNTSLPYTGNRTVKIKKNDIQLIDKATKKDLSAYIDADSNGFVTLNPDPTSNDGTPVSIGEGNQIYIKLKNPDDGLGNYKVAQGGDNQGWVKTTNKLKCVARDLSTVNVVLKDQSWTGSAVTLKQEDIVSIKDKETGVDISLDEGDLIITAPTNAVNCGTGYTATITPKTGSTKFKGSATATFAIVSDETNFMDAAFEKAGSASSGLLSRYYTGSPITFTSSELGALTKGGKEIASENYNISYEANTNAGTGYIVVTGKLSYAGSVLKVPFTINPVKASTPEAKTYVEKINTTDGKDYKDAMAVTVKATNPDTDKTVTLKEGTDYTVEYKIINDSGKDKVQATVTVTNPNYINPDTKVVTSEITPTVLKDENIKLKETSFTYTGKAITPEFDVVVGGKYISPTKYDYQFDNNIDAGTATLTVKGKGVDFSNLAEAKVTFTIKAADSSKLAGTIGSKAYTGYSLTVPASDIDLTLDGEKIDVASNFTITNGENVNIGEGTVTLTPKNNNFTGTKTITFKIVGQSLNAGGSFVVYDENNLKVPEADWNFDYDGTTHTFSDVAFTYADSSVKLTKGTDYELKYVDNVYGKATDNGQYGAVLVIAKGKYGSSYNSKNSNNQLDGRVVNGVYTDAEGNKITDVMGILSFQINQQRVTRNNIILTNGVYAGGLKVAPTVSITVKGVKLVEGKDYKIVDLDSTVLDRTNATATDSLGVGIVLMNGYRSDETGDDGIIWMNWGIDKFDLENADVTVQDGKLVVKCGQIEVPASEYTTVVNDDGTTTVTAVKTSKNYKGSKVVDTNGTTDAEKPETPILAAVKVVGNKATAILSGESDGATGYDYVISTDRDCITSKDYDKVNKNILSTEADFTYVQQGTYYAYCHAWKRVNGKKVFSDWSNVYPFTVTAVTPDQPVITSVKTSGSTVRVTYTKAANATGYDVVLGTEAKKVNGEKRPVEYGTLVKKITNGDTVTAVFKNVPEGTYYAGLHAWNRTSADGKKVFSPWSNVQAVTVK